MAAEQVLIDLGNSLDRLSKPIDFTPAMKSCLVYSQATAKENFDRQAAPDGVPWAPLKKPRRYSRRVSKRQKKNKGTDKILRDKGILMNDLVGKGPDSIGIVTPISMEHGTNADYGNFHMTGTMDLVGKRSHIEGQKGMPARPFLGFEDDDVENLTDIIEGFAERTVVRILG